jgi:capsular polysaccharide biosynthesis protein
MAPSQLQHQVTVTAPTDDVIQIQARARRASDAVALANAIATAFIAYMNSSNLSSGGAVLGDLQQESTLLAHQAQDIQNQITAITARLGGEGPSSADGQRDDAMLTWLRAQSNDVSQLINVNSQSVATQITAGPAGAATRMLQRASVSPSSRLQAEILDGAIGLMAGLIVATAITFVQFRRDRRLRLRDHIARAVGASVIASVAATKCVTTDDWTKFFEGYRPSSVEAWSLRRALHRLVSGNAESSSVLRVVCFSDDGPAITAGVVLAKCAAALGISTTIAPSHDDELVPLRAAFLTQFPPAREPLLTVDSVNSERGPATSLTICLDAVDKERPELDPFGGVSVLSVSSGFATAEVLARVSLAAIDAGGIIDGVILVNPDPNDDTVGLASDKPGSILLSRRMDEHSDTSITGNSTSR